MGFGKNLIALREKNGITRTELADHLEIPYTTLRNYENEQREPGHKLLVRIARMFSVTVDSLIDNTPTQIPIRPAEPRIAKKLPQLTDEQLVYIEGSVDALISQNKKAAPKDGQDDGKGATETSSISGMQKDA